MKSKDRWECMPDCTRKEFVLEIKARPMPPDYAFTPTEKLTFDGLVKRVDDAVADMIRMADSGEFDGYTPVKGKDYFTADEIKQIQDEVSSGAVGDFKSVVDAETETFKKSAEAWTHGHPEYPERDEDNAKYYAGMAKEAADHAEQAAEKSGYMQFDIENGRLIETVTDNVGVGFVMEEGRLYLL